MPSLPCHIDVKPSQLRGNRNQTPYQKSGLHITERTRITSIKNTRVNTNTETLQATCVRCKTVHHKKWNASLNINFSCSALPKTLQGSPFSPRSTTGKLTTKRATRPNFSSKSRTSTLPRHSSHHSPTQSSPTLKNRSTVLRILASKRPASWWVFSMLSRSSALVHRFRTVNNLPERDGTLQCSAGPEWYGCHGTFSTVASTWAPAVGLPSESAAKKKKLVISPEKTSTWPPIDKGWWRKNYCSVSVKRS